MFLNNNCLVVVIILLHVHLESTYLFAYVWFLVHYNTVLEFNLAVFAECPHYSETVKKCLIMAENRILC